MDRRRTRHCSRSINHRACLHSAALLVFQRRASCQCGGMRSRHCCRSSVDAGGHQAGLPVRRRPHHGNVLNRHHGGRNPCSRNSGWCVPFRGLGSNAGAVGTACSPCPCSVARSIVFGCLRATDGIPSNRWSTTVTKRQGLASAHFLWRRYGRLYACPGMAATLLCSIGGAAKILPAICWRVLR